MRFRLTNQRTYLRIESCAHDNKESRKDVYERFRIVAKLLRKRTTTFFLLFTSYPRPNWKSDPIPFFPFLKFTWEEKKAMAKYLNSPLFTPQIIVSRLAQYFCSPQKQVSLCEQNRLLLLENQTRDLVNKIYENNGNDDDDDDDDDDDNKHWFVQLQDQIHVIW